MVAEVEENNLGNKALNARFGRWYECSLCEQDYHGVVRCALGWACWKTYLGRPQTDDVQGHAMNMLGNGLNAAEHHEDALTVKEAHMSFMRRVGDMEYNILIVQGNIASSYQKLGRIEALNMYRDVYSGWLKLSGEENYETLSAANSYVNYLLELGRLDEAKSLLRKTMTVARRVLGDSNDITIRIRMNYAQALYKDPAATLDDLREAVNTLDDSEPTARRVLGGAHPIALGIAGDLRASRAALRARETPSPGLRNW